MFKIKLIVVHCIEEQYGAEKEICYNLIPSSMFDVLTLLQFHIANMPLARNLIF